jgi:hypothetical protein
MLESVHRHVTFSHHFTAPQVKNGWKMLEKNYKKLHRQHKQQTGQGLMDEERIPGVIDNKDDLLKEEWPFWTAMDELCGDTMAISPPG